MIRCADEPITVVQVAVVKGEVSRAALEHTREKVGGILRLASAPVLSARVTLAHEVAPDIHIRRHWMATANRYTPT